MLNRRPIVASLAGVVLAAFCCSAFSQQHADAPAKPAASAPSTDSPVDAAGKLKPGEYTARIGGLLQWFKIRGSGPVCILPTPGWGPSSELYIQSIAKLEESFTVVYFDTRSTGKTQVTTALDGLKRSDLASDIDTLRQLLKQDKIWIFGHSAGCMLTFQYVLDYSEHTAGLILVGASISTDDKAREAANKQAQRVMREPWFPIAKKAMQDDVLRMKAPVEFKGSVMRELPIYFYDQEKLRDLRWTFEQTDYSLVAAQQLAASNPLPMTVQPRLSDIKCPTIIICGASDIDAGPYQAQLIKDGIKGAKMFVIPESAHFPWMEQPEKFFAALKEGLSAVK